MSTDTPRTDAALRAYPTGSTKVLHAEFTRTLEREINNLKTEMARRNAEVAESLSLAGKAVAQLRRDKAELAAKCEQAERVADDRLTQSAESHAKCEQMREALAAYAEAVTEPKVFFALDGEPTERLKRAGALHKDALSSTPSDALAAYEADSKRLDWLGKNWNDFDPLDWKIKYTCEASADALRATIDAAIAATKPTT